jgi:hypothetical protein
MTVPECIRRLIEQLTELAGPNGELPAIDEVDIHPVEEQPGTFFVAVRFRDPELNGGMPAVGEFVADDCREVIELSLYAAGALRRALNRHRTLERIAAL